MSSETILSQSSESTSFLCVNKFYNNIVLCVIVSEGNRYVKAADADADISEEETLAYINVNTTRI